MNKALKEHNLFSLAVFNLYSVLLIRSSRTSHARLGAESDSFVYCRFKFIHKVLHSILLRHKMFQCCLYLKTFILIYWNQALIAFYIYYVYLRQNKLEIVLVTPIKTQQSLVECSCFLFCCNCSHARVKCKNSQKRY